MKMHYRIALRLLLHSPAIFVYGQEPAKGLTPDLIPLPQQLAVGRGYYSIGSKRISYYVSDKQAFKSELDYLRKNVLPNLSEQSSDSVIARIRLVKKAGCAQEGYELTINEGGITLAASAGAGMFYALQTLRQLILLTGNNGQVDLPFIDICDRPAFQWRGIELDVARHFFSKEYLFRLMDLLALYKFNTLHLHLTDNQGWRIEIKRYPRLVGLGAWRPFNNLDSACIEKQKENPDFALPPERIRIVDGKKEYGGYYTQADIREIVEYAADRHIEIVPEIDMPGHIMIAAKAYPALLDTDMPGWGKQFTAPLCVCKDDVYRFVEDILQEVIDLFPGRYIHIGADEVDKTSWQNSPVCLRFMTEHGLTDMNQLQSYFVNRVNRFIRSRGKIAIGWDEILEGAVDSTMRVMYWRTGDRNAPLKAAANHQDVIMTPNNPLYFDYLPNKSSLPAVYQFRVVPGNLSANQASFIKGAQANVWTEMIPSAARLEFMLLPRITALAERVWTNKDSLESYQRRVWKHYTIWDKIGLHYRFPDLGGFTDEQVIVDGKAMLRVSGRLPGAAVHYTTDGSIPGFRSPVLKDNMIISHATDLRLAAISKNGATSELYSVKFKEAAWIKGAKISSADVKPGLSLDIYNGKFWGTKEIRGTSVQHEIIPNVHLEDMLAWPSFGARLKGYLKVPDKAVYNFYLTCDDGGVLYIHEQVVVDNDGTHSPVEKSGQIALEAGIHPFRIDFVEAGSGFTLKLNYSRNGGKEQKVPDEWFYH